MFFSKTIGLFLVLGWVSGFGGSFKILTGPPGIYWVSYEMLVAAGMNPELSPSREWALHHRGEAVPIWVSHGGDGLFGPGDWLEFEAGHLAGEYGFYHEYMDHNVFILSRDGSRAKRLIGKKAEVSAVPERSLYRGTLRMEVDTLLARFRGRRFEAHEIWYWQKLACTDEQAFTQTFTLTDLDFDSERPFQMEIGLRGWSTIAKKAQGTSDHVLQIYLNEHLVEETSWDGGEVFTRKFDLQVKSFLNQGENRWSLRVPRRKDEKGQILVDVTLLNWVNFEYPKKGIVKDSAQTVFVDETSASGSRTLTTDWSHLTIYTAGSRIVLRDGKGIHRVPDQSVVFTLAEDEHRFTVLPAAGFYRPAAVLPMDEPRIRLEQKSADYVMIVHPSLREAVLPLAAFHQSRGLRVEIVDVGWIYDEFNHGIEDPRAIRDFLKFAYYQWRPPRPRYVLMVGDASWDTKNNRVIDKNYPDWAFSPVHRTRFSKNGSTFYADLKGNDRNLVPTWNLFIAHGHAASDNSFVCLDGDDFYPDMAIGRFPVTTPEEVGAIVAKTIAYAQGPEPGPWRRNTLWITNEQKMFQRRTNHLASEMTSRGFFANKIYPDSEERSNEHHSQSIIDALDEGQYLVYFYGHGGRYIWRTGPPDHRKNHDLFTLDHLSRLEPSHKLPVVLSFTCYSAPFNHPGADSIGEKFLRNPGNGAVAFVGASWRNSPNMKMNQAFLKAFSHAGTAGEALMEAKRGLNDRTLVETYLLLGDPALPLSPPMSLESLHCEYLPEKKAYRLRGQLPPSFSGRGLVDAVDEDGRRLADRSFSLSGDHFEVVFAEKELKEGCLYAFQCYLWDPSSRRDAMGTVVVATPETKATKETAPAP